MTDDLALTPTTVGLAAASAVLLILVLVLLVAWLRARAARNAATAERTEAGLARIELELAVAENSGRLRIIREVHEVAVHDLTGIISQADAAGYASEADPQAAVRAAAAIATAARSTLADIRRVLDLSTGKDDDIVAQPGLDSIPELLSVMTDAGLDVRFSQVGEPFDLKQGAELAVYGILQIALNNAMAHGGPGTIVTASFTWTDESLQLLVDDDGVQAAARRTGTEVVADTDSMTALTGVLAGAEVTEMRERAELFGGVFKAYPVAGVGFSVAVVFPSLKYHNGVHSVNLA